MGTGGKINYNFCLSCFYAVTRSENTQERVTICRVARSGRMDDAERPRHRMRGFGLGGGQDHCEVWEHGGDELNC